MATRSELEQKVVELAWKDAGFKAQLLSDPRAALEQGADLRIPDGVTVKVLEESADTIYVVIPQNPDAELSEEELEAVAGGVDEVLPIDGGGGEIKPTTRGCVVTPRSRRCTRCF